MTKIVMPKVGSRGEETFAVHCKVYKLTPAREFRFHPLRRWRFDFAFPDVKLAVEVEGGTWAGGRHNRGAGMAEDMNKYNAATLAGWRVLRYTTEMVQSGTAIDDVLNLIGKS
jgi:very-short-patch-repair endonuclease